MRHMMSLSLSMLSWETWPHRHYWLLLPGSHEMGLGPDNHWLSFLAGAFQVLEWCNWSTRGGEGS